MSGISLEQKIKATVMGDTGQTAWMALVPVGKTWNEDPYVYVRDTDGTWTVALPAAGKYEFILYNNEDSLDLIDARSEEINVQVSA